MSHFEIYEEVKFGAVQVRRDPNYPLVRVVIPDELENLIIEGNPRAIYRSLLNAADRLRSEYAKAGLDFNFDRRVV